MKILFIYPNLTRQEYISLGIAYLSSYLKKEGHQTYLMDYTFGGSFNDCLNKIRKVKLDIIGFSLRSGEFPFSLQLAQEIKKNFDLPIIFGGVHPTVAPEETISKKPVDMICIGEGELALAELFNKMEKGKDYTKTRNFWFKKDGLIIRNPIRPLIQNLDRLPFPDRELSDFERYLDCRNGAVDILMGRGCPFNCTYCINHILQKLYKNKGRYVRTRSVNNILEEIRSLTNDYKINYISFQDDVFGIDKKWIKEFSQKYSKEFKLPFSCNIRPEMATEELCKDLKKAGCTTLNIGIESGSEKLRKNVLNRYNSNDDIKRAFRMARKADLATYSFNMVGLPFETDNDVQKTIELNQQIKPDFLQVSIFQPYPGTELRRICEEKKWLTENDIPISHKTDSILNYPKKSASKIKRQKQFFRYNVLKKGSLKKALLILVFDLNESLFTKLRDKIPISLKKLLFRIDSSLKIQRKDQFVNLEKITSILVFMGEGIGNLIVSAPFLKVLKRELPKTKITFLIKTKKYPRDFFRTFPYVDQIIELDDNLFRNIKIIRGLQKIKLDLIIPAFPETKFRKVLCFFLNPKYKINYPSDLVFSDKSTVEIELDAIKRFGINVEASDYKLGLFFKPDNSEKIKKIIKKQCLYRNFIGFHVGSRKSIPTRLWPAKRWAKVADFLASQKFHKIVFVGGKEDRQETKKVMKLMKSPAVNLVSRLKIEETAAIMKKFKLFICANSGPMHIAAALNIPTVTLCGPSLEQWYPYNKNAAVVRKIINRKYCNPPCDAKKCKYEDNLCMESIKTEDVIESISGQLNLMREETFK